MRRGREDKVWYGLVKEGEMKKWIGQIKVPASRSSNGQTFTVEASNLTTAVTRLLQAALPEYTERGNKRPKTFPQAQTVQISICRVQPYWDVP